MIDHLYACDDKKKFPRFLQQAKIAHKSGSVNATRTDAGWIDSPAGRIVLCVLTNENKDQSWGDENEAEILCGRIAERVYLHFNPEGLEPSDAVEGPLKVGANGLLVEGLQRTLNARMEPSPGLSIDGDFGSVTEAVVIDFQKSKGIEPSGVVGPETWAALGPIVDEESGDGDSAVIARAPADELTGPPFVTCKAWGIGDASTGKLLWGTNAEQSLDIASTTKMMTAFLTIKLASEKPEVLDEKLTFSPRADQTVGSSATIRAGETVVVRDLLYGLMLPSGNDASVALAEHFGHRLAGTEGDAAAAYDGFISVMNKTASELGMTHTHYVNPHGLSADGHKSSVSDLILLASTALKLPLYREVVNTARHECLVEGPAGYRRRMRWENTNQLLGIEGYDGVKTGTTSAAGACLVSHGTRDGRSLLIVVLGCTSSDARYVDTRNLFRWAWNQK
jgi:D-alanyl-D-alanine carboxypeptidase (penicillin-binding protein 5/6)